MISIYNTIGKLRGDVELINNKKDNRYKFKRKLENG